MGEHLGMKDILSSIAPVRSTICLQRRSLLNQARVKSSIARPLALRWWGGKVADPLSWSKIHACIPPQKWEADFCQEVLVQTWKFAQKLVDCLVGKLLAVVQDNGWQWPEHIISNESWRLASDFVLIKPDCYKSSGNFRELVHFPISLGLAEERLMVTSTLCHNKGRRLARGYLSIDFPWTECSNRVWTWPIILLAWAWSNVRIMYTPF
jgi:hypothetical protein